MHGWICPACGRYATDYYGGTTSFDPIIPGDSGDAEGYVCSECGYVWSAAGFNEDYGVLYVYGDHAARQMDALLVEVDAPYKVLIGDQTEWTDQLCKFDRWALDHGYPSLQQLCPYYNMTKKVKVPIDFTGDIAYRKYALCDKPNQPATILT